MGSIPGLGRYPGEGNSYPLPYSVLENSMDSPWDRKELDIHPSTFLLKCRPQKWRKWKRTREKLPLSISQECLAEMQGQRGESLPATLTGWNCHSFPPLPASDESRNTHQRRGGGQDTIPALPPPPSASGSSVQPGTWESSRTPSSGPSPTSPVSSAS